MLVIVLLGPTGEVSKAAWGACIGVASGDGSSINTGLHSSWNESEDVANALQNVQTKLVFSTEYAIKNYAHLIKIPLMNKSNVLTKVSSHLKPVLVDIDDSSDCTSMMEWKQKSLQNWAQI